MRQSDLRTRNRGAYQQPHSGVGVEFSPLSGPLKEPQIILYETGYLAHNVWWNFPNTISPFWRLYYNATPGHKVILANREILLDPDIILIIPDRQIFHTHGVEAARHCWVTFSLPLISKTPEPIVLPADAESLAMIQRICDSFTGVGEGDRFAIYHGSMSLVHHTILQMRSHLQDVPRSPVLESIVEYVQTHFQEPLEVPALAKMAGLTPRALSAHFHKEYHCSPAHFIMQVRVRDVARLLANTRLTIDEIASAVGFADRFYLTRVFTRLVGKSPAKFRREYRN